MSVEFLNDHQVMSPEGLEEEVVFDLRAIVTRTQGERYRVYHVENPAKTALTPGRESHLSVRDAHMDAARRVGIMAAMVLEPEKVMMMVVKGLEDMLKKRGT